MVKIRGKIASRNEKRKKKFSNCLNEGNENDNKLEIKLYMYVYDGRAAPGAAATGANFEDTRYVRVGMGSIEGWPPCGERSSYPKDKGTASINYDATLRGKSPLQGTFVPLQGACACEDGTHTSYRLCISIPALNNADVGTSGYGCMDVRPT